MDKEWNAPTIPSDNSPPSFLSPGMEIKGFRLESEFAQGGMGVVWKATQLKTKRTVAFKMILGGITGKSTDKVRFMAESVAMASVKHSHIVEVLEFGDAHGRLFLAMEFMPGGTLADKIRAYNRFDPKAAARILAKICLGVQAAHDHGIVHRDLKPENILFDRNFEPKVTDFGLAKQDEITINTVSYSVLGTPYYMAPEQAEGKSRFVGPQADIYALGVILYECLTGTLPFDGDNPLVVIRRVAEEAPEAPRRRVSAISRDIERICLKCLAKDPSERYQSCHELAEDLHRFINDKPVLAQKSSNLGRLMFWANRNKALAITATSALALILIATLGFAGLSIWALTERDNAKTNLVNANSSKVEAEESAKRAFAHQEVAESRVYISHVQGALNEWTYGRPPIARDLLAECPFERRGWEHNFVNTTVEANQVVLEGHTARIQSVAYCPNGKWIASASDDQTIKIWDAHLGTLVDTLKGHKSYVRSVCFSADSSTMASAGSDKTIKIWDVQKRTVKNTIDLASHNNDPYFFGTSVALNPDGKYVAVSRLNQHIMILDTVSGKILRPLNSISELSHHVSFSPDGTRLISCGSLNNITLWDWINGKVIRTFTGDPNTRIRSAIFNDNGKTILAGGDDNKSRLWDIETGKLIHTFTGHTDAVTSVAISPNGKWIASGSDDHTLRIWNAESGQFIRALKGHGHVIRGTAFSPDGKRLVSGSWDKTVRVWDFSSDQGPKIWPLESKKSRDLCFAPDNKTIIIADVNGTLSIGDSKSDFLVKPNTSKNYNHCFCVNSSPDGTHLLGGCVDSNIYIWDFPKRKLVKTLAGHKQSIQSACYTPDGKRIISGADDNTVKIWDAFEGKVLKTLDDHRDNVLGVNASPDGKWFASASADKTIKIWDTRDYSLKWDLLGCTNKVRSVAFSPDSKRLVSGDTDNTIRIWNMENGKLVRALKGHIDGITRVSYSPDGKRILSSSYDNSLKLWDAETGAEILTLAQHNASVRSARFSPDGKTIASVGDEGKAIIWEATDRQEQMAFKGHDGKITQAGFGPDEKYLISRDDRGFTKIWDRSNGNEITGEEFEILRNRGNTLESQSRDGRWKVEIRGQDLLLVDLEARIARLARDKHRLETWGPKPGE